MEYGIRNTLTGVIICISLHTIVSCKLTDNAIQGSIPSASPPEDTTLSSIPSNLESTPSIFFNLPVNTERPVSRVEARVYKYGTSTPISEWITINSGDSISGLSLNKFESYFLKIRGIDVSGKASEEIMTQAWKPDSNDCKGSLLTNSPYATGTGSITDPFLICTAQQLNYLAENNSQLNYNFKLAANIDLLDTTFNGIRGQYSGHFDGNQKTIKNINIVSSSLSNVGFFNSTHFAQIYDLTLQDISVQASSASNVGSLIGYADYTKTNNVNIYNFTVNGDNTIGGLAGIFKFSLASNTNLTGEVGGVTCCVGGIIGFAIRGELLMATANVNVTAINADQVGGITGWEATPSVYQYINVFGDIVGRDEVGGFSGTSTDGQIFYKSNFTGSITGNYNVGGFFGAAQDSPTGVLSSSANVTLNGTQNVGGFTGRNDYRSYYTNSYVTGTINTSGTPQQNVGGVLGLANGKIYVTNGYSNMTINGAAENVGGLVGMVSWWDTSHYINDFFVASSVEGSSASDFVSLYLGQNLDVNAIGTNLNYWSGGTCTNSGAGNCNSDEGSGVADVTQFHNEATLPATWDFTEVWLENTGAFPTLRQSSLQTPVVSHSCATSIIANTNSAYSCNITAVDADIDETQFVVFKEGNTCSWLYAVHYSGLPRITGTPPADSTDCLLSFIVTDGINESANESLTINVTPSIGIVPNIKDGGRYQFGSTASNSGNVNKVFTLTNFNSSTATSLNVSLSNTTHFNFSGGSYPGTGQTCTTSLAAGASCTFEVTFAPTSVGVKTISIILDYDIGSAVNSSGLITGTGI